MVLETGLERFTAGVGVLTTYLEFVSCTTLASVTSKMSFSGMKRVFELRQFSCSCLVIMFEVFGEGPIGLVSINQKTRLTATVKHQVNKKLTKKWGTDICLQIDCKFTRTISNVFKLKGRTRIKTVFKRRIFFHTSSFPYNGCS